MIRSGLYITMTITVLFCLAQKPTFDIEFHDKPIDSVLQIVTMKTGYFFSYNSDILPEGSRYSMNEVSIDIDRFLNKLLLGIDVEHQIMNDQIILRQKTISTSPEAQRKVFSINGQVKDSTTNEPISGVNVFLSGTNLGGVSDIDGFYSISRIPVGSYEVIFSHLTYKMVFHEAELLTQGVLTISSQMALEARMLDTVEVVSKRLIGENERSRFIRIFEHEFLGRSENASKCQLVNPEVLDFIFDPQQDKLEVFALEPVVVINNQLGYEITYYFDIFQKISDSVNFYGKARFQNLKPENIKQERRWIKNREKVYNGSFLHFRRALVANELKKEQFRISLVETDKLDEITSADLLTVSRKEILFDVSETTYKLDFDGFLMVTYRRKPDELYNEQFYDRVSSRAMQHSFIRLNQAPVILKSNGRMEYPGMATFGYWYWERIGDLLPENYYSENETL